jgi:hypothetical protein
MIAVKIGGGVSLERDDYPKNDIEEHPEAAHDGEDGEGEAHDGGVDTKVFPQTAAYAGDHFIGSTSIEFLHKCLEAMKRLYNAIIRLRLKA